MITKNFYTKNQRGLSLIELMVVVVILGLIVLGLVTFFMGGTKSWVAGQSQLEAQRNARQAMDRMVREIREGKKLLSGSDGSTIIINFPSSFGKNDVTYSWSGTIGDPVNRISNILINNVHNLHFDYSDENGDPIASASASRVNIDLQVDVDKDNNPDITLNTDVKLRNYGL